MDKKSDRRTSVIDMSPLCMTNLFDEYGKPRRLIDIEREQFKVLMIKCHGNVSEIAKITGMDRKQVYRRLFKTGLYTPKNGVYYDYSEEKVTKERIVRQLGAEVLSAAKAGKINKRVIKADKKVYDNALMGD